MGRRIGALLRSASRAVLGRKETSAESHADMANTTGAYGRQDFGAVAVRGLAQAAILLCLLTWLPPLSVPPGVVACSSTSLTCPDGPESGAESSRALTSHPLSVGGRLGRSAKGSTAPAVSAGLGVRGLRADRSRGGGSCAGRRETERRVESTGRERGREGGRERGRNRGRGRERRREGREPWRRCFMLSGDALRARAGRTARRLRARRWRDHHAAHRFAHACASPPPTLSLFCFLFSLIPSHPPTPLYVFVLSLSLPPSPLPPSLSSFSVLSFSLSSSSNVRTLAVAETDTQIDTL
eukprot:scaffold28216_cov31-Tisochrysis_lutea.AAC.5